MIDKSWIHKSITSTEYKCGVEEFLEFAFARAAINGKIICPCIKCGFNNMGTRIEVLTHLLQKGFPEKYTSWYMHGETIVQPEEELLGHNHTEPVEKSPLHDMLTDVFGIDDINYEGDDDEPFASRTDSVPMPSENDTNEDSRRITELLKDGNRKLYPGCAKYTKLSFIVELYHIKVLCGATDKTFSMIVDLLNNAFSHANLPTSFYEGKKMIKLLGLGYERIHACPNNFEENTSSNTEVVETSQDQKKKIPAKVLRYFPLTPRLRRLYMSSKTARLMRWHSEFPNSDGKLKHPRDSKAWKYFDLLHPEFAKDPRNIRLALATDGFNPFGTLSSNISIWPVMLYIYNYPPWYCMKQTSLIMSMIIPGPKMPGNNIDIFLQPLICELNELWKGVDVYDSVDGNNFRMHAALFWTISDFPGLDNLSGWNTHTSLACPSCNFDTISRRLKFVMKYCFMGHRRWLPDDHEYRHNKHSFDGHTELRGPPPTLSGRRILSQIESSRKRPQDALNDGNIPLQWKKRSIFWDLPYWKDNLVRHCLDMMHIEKNVCDNVLFTILDDKQRTKDNLQARKDLQLMGIREQLHPYPNSSKCVDIKKRKVSGLKSHDSHILLEHILPIALRRSLPKEVISVLIELCNYFREVSGKSLSLENLERLQQRIVLTLCHMEMIFPPAFFTIMVHLVIHLVEEAMIAGPVQYRWMYPVERALGHLKSYVRNKAAPEGCIAEGYIIEECLTFCSRYLEDGNIETRKCRCEIARIYRGRKNATKLVEEYIHAKFHEWFRDYVAKNNDPDITPEIKWLAEGPNDIVKRFEEFNVHGFKFRTMKKDQGLKTQNCGVVMSAITNSVSNGRNPIIVASDNTYYGKVVDMIELDYFGKLRVVLFKCIWVDTTLNKGIKIDQFGITSVNFSNLIHTGDNETDEPFILATDARMVYYVDDPVDEGWCSVCHMKPRDLYDMGDLNEEELDESLVEDIPFCEQQVENLKEFQLTRDEIDEADQDEMHVDENDDNDCDDDDDEIDNLDNI
ncbi:uncharacterized protein [Arachis hypogaea]|uniref:uncharacterized protein n=1 Tax=Arachis hypogaea TaxID=3818 RepID=UPI000DEC3F73|nr:uncharacterized protein LOC112757915 [Arachis hypogaea]XP_025704091.1 uncharacterized protein LOC112805991 [Arachis hypogaea]